MGTSGDISKDTPYFPVQMGFLFFGGISMIPFRNAFQKFLYNIYSLSILMGCCYFYTIMEAYNLFYITDDILKLTLNLSYSVTHILATTKTTIVLIRKRKIMALLDSLKTGVFVPNINRGGPKEVSLVKEAIFYSSLQCALFIGTGVPILSCRVIFVIIQGELPFEQYDPDFNVTSVIYQRETPYPFFFDFDTRNIIIYALISTYQIWAYLAQGFHIGGIDAIICGCILQVRSQYMIIYETLDRIFMDCHVKGTDSYNEDDLPEEGKAADIHQRVVECVNHHQKLLEFSKAVEDEFKYLLLLQFMSSLMILCFGLFQLSVTSIHSFAFASIVFYNLLMIAQVLLYCFMGQLVYSASDNLSTHIFNLPWVVSLKKTKHALLLMMMRSQRPTKFTAGNFAFLELQTFITILRASFSYFTFLKQVNTDED